MALLCTSMIRLRRLRYNHEKGVHRSYSLLLLGLLSVTLIGMGLYLMMILNAPNVQSLDPVAQKAFVPPTIGEHTLVIPKIAVNVEVLAGNQSVLKKGAWHRVPERGDPVMGGNFVLSGHRFVVAKTPAHTKQQSYFYNIDKLNVGDEILVDWKKTRYTYKITKVYTVKPTQLEIEAPSKKPKMTLYTCTLAGSADGRVVIEAEPVKADAQAT